MTFKAKTTKSTVIALLTRSVQRVKSVSHYTFLGFVFDTELSVDEDIQSSTVARKSSLGGLRSCGGGLDIENLIKTSMIYSVSYFDLEETGSLFGGLSPSNPLKATGLIQRQLQYQYYAVNKLRASFFQCPNTVKNVLFPSVCCIDVCITITVGCQEGIHPQLAYGL